MATSQQVDAGARFLRETLQSGKNLNPWDGLPMATKRKWLTLAQGVLAASEKA